jgi:SET domain
VSQSALAAYDCALKAPGAQKIHGALYSNISATCLHLSKPGRAYLSAITALATNPAEPALIAKALFRQASAAYQLRCFSETESLFTCGLAVARSDAKAQGLVKEFNECLARTSQRLRERDTGAYDFQTMFSDVITGGPDARIDVADFVGPVEILSSAGRGRGLYATRDVAVGDLLFVSKAVSVGSKKDPEIKNVAMFIFNLASDRIRRAIHYLGTTRLVHSCIDNPALYSTICQLYDGIPPSSPSTPPLGIVDTEKQVLEQLGTVIDVDVGRLEHICVLNSFGDPSILPYISFDDPAEGKRAEESLNENKRTLLFYLPSFCNHSCVPNAQRTLFGDVMVVRALVRLSQGDEITLGYASCNAIFEEREKTLEYFGFKCDCWFCREEEMDGKPARERRKEAVDAGLSEPTELIRQTTGQAHTRNQGVSAAIRAIEHAKDKVQATYHPERGQFRPEMFHLWKALSVLYHNTGIEWRKLIEVLSFVILSTSTFFALTTVASYQIEKHALTALGAVMANIDSTQLKNRKESSSKPTIMLSQLPLALVDGAVHSVLLIAAGHKMLGVSSTLAQAMTPLMQPQELELQRNWVATAIWVHDVHVGGGLPVLKKRCPKGLKGIL